jgi:16S rRNA pseudouridine516 synthase
MIQKRIDQLFSNFGFGSRKDALAWLRAGRIQHMSQKISSVSDKVLPGDLLIDNKPLEYPSGIYIALNKPAGFACTHSSAEGSTIYSLLPTSWHTRSPKVESVGRLDKDTTGIILLTDEMGLLHTLTSPKANISKEYRVTVEQSLKEYLVDAFRAGTLMLHNETKPCLPAELIITGEHTATIIITEGRFHQVKRMFAAFGFCVTELTRVRFGVVELGDLEVGKYRDCENGFGM